jgi:hypothetical protein
MDKGRRMEKAMKPWIARIKKCDWFANVGTGELEGVGRVGSWKEVKQHLEGDEWDTMGLASLNDHHKATSKSPKKLQDVWNDGFDDLFDVIDELLERTLLPVIKKRKIPNSVLDSFQSKIIVLFSQLHHFGADYQSIDRSIVEWYLAGHCACGYGGDYPHGKLIVY